MTGWYAVLISLAVSGASVAAQNIGAPPPNPALAIARGGGVFTAQKCAKCHSLDGKDARKRSLDAIGSRLTAEEIRLWIVDPVDMADKTDLPHKPKMKSYAKLPAADLAALVAFLAARTTP